MTESERLARVETLCEEIKRDVLQVRTSLEGNGQPGIKTRLDRLEQIEERRKWTIRTIMGGGIAILLKQWFG